MSKALSFIAVLYVLFDLSPVKACLQMKDLRPKKFNEIRDFSPIPDNIRDGQAKFSLAPYLAFSDEKDAKFGQDGHDPLALPSLDTNPIEAVQLLPLALKAIFRF